MSNKIEILSITNNPITFAGRLAGICYGSTNEKRFKGIGLYCLESDHGRVFENINITFAFDEYSAKVIREMFRHKAGTTELQASTRYIDYSKDSFKYVTPPSVMAIDEAVEIWDCVMNTIQVGMSGLKGLGVPVEDFTNLLPLAYETKGVYTLNLRALLHMFEVRSCACAYWEFRNLMGDIKKAIISTGDAEWIELADSVFVPKCEKHGYCNEKTRNCGRRPLRDDK